MIRLLEAIHLRPIKIQSRATYATSSPLVKVGFGFVLVMLFVN